MALVCEWKTTQFRIRSQCETNKYWWLKADCDYRSYDDHAIRCDLKRLDSSSAAVCTCDQQVEAFSTKKHSFSICPDVTLQIYQSTTSWMQPNTNSLGIGSLISLYSPYNPTQKLSECSLWFCGLLGPFPLRIITCSKECVKQYFYKLFEMSQ